MRRPSRERRIRILSFTSRISTMSSQRIQSATLAEQPQQGVLILQADVAEVDVIAVLHHGSRDRAEEQQNQADHRQRLVVGGMLGEVHEEDRRRPERRRARHDPRHGRALEHENAVGIHRFISHNTGNWAGYVTTESAVGSRRSAVDRRPALGRLGAFCRLPTADCRLVLIRSRIPAPCAGPVISSIRFVKFPPTPTSSSQKLMMRAGMIRKVAAGIYTYLPLGLRSIQKLENIVREEMDARRRRPSCSCPPSSRPSSGWSRAAGRSTGRSSCASRTATSAISSSAPTHEEVITDTVRDAINSYRQLPVNALPDPDASSATRSVRASASCAGASSS